MVDHEKEWVLGSCCCGNDSGWRLRLQHRSRRRRRRPGGRRRGRGDGRADSGANAQAIAVVSPPPVPVMTVERTGESGRARTDLKQRVPRPGENSSALGKDGPRAGAGTKRERRARLVGPPPELLLRVFRGSSHAGTGRFHVLANAADGIAPRQAYRCREKPEKSPQGNAILCHNDHLFT
jgi:hypothetical protein